MFLCGCDDALPKLLDLREVEFRRDSEAYIKRARMAHLSIELTDHSNCAFVSQMLEREVDEVEVHAFDEGA